MASSSTSELDLLKARVAELEAERAELMKVKDKAATSSDYYWDSYAHFGIHEEMIKDDVRTQSYHKAILQNKYAFEGKVVMDVGAGSGILSLFCAKAGAKKVLAVECSSVADLAKEVVAANGYQDTVIVIKEKIEDIKELPEGIEKVDIIVSEWMGYCLLYESMLNSVLYARDKWLRKKEDGGMMFPSKAQIFIAGIEDAEYKDQKIGFWDMIYGFTFAPFKRVALLEPLVEVAEARQLCTTTATVVEFDLHTCTVEDLNFSDKPFTLQLARKDSVHALICWFDTVFDDCHQRIRIATGPRNPYTHWKQTVFYLDKVLHGLPGEEVHGTMSIQSNKANFRDLDIKFNVDFKGKVNEAKFHQDFRLR
eukprot:NODE_1488_length_1398_cov_319.753892_g1236_i0.p2 GENE.NODE_1488_length_1398_cov_319.753892_g1236_i0~~NODE_1488_length_1398_cov_319.753892_g1236_i0.p2  ORF type:complete len:366 (-),score=154.56 NODE_1488_length_1398_cov_319.753892_g1236_i0:140-1237(-)